MRDTWLQIVDYIVLSIVESHILFDATLTYKGRPK